MRIAILTDDFPPASFGGAGLSTYDLAAGLQRAGHTVTVITTCRSPGEAGQSEYHGLTIFRVLSAYPSRWRAYVSINNRSVVRKMERLLGDLRPDIVHAHNIHEHLSYASLTAAKRYAPVVVTFRDVMSFNYGKLVTKRYLETLDARVTWRDQLRQAGKRWNPLRNFFIKRYLKSPNALVAISQALQTALAQNGITPVSVIYNGIDADAWQARLERLEEFRATHALAGKKVLLFSGRLSPAKGGEQVVEALAHIAKEIPNAVVLVAGTKDAYAEVMQKHAERLGVGERLIFTGWIDGEDLRAAYAASDVVLFPSVCFDAFGRVNLEAMAAKKPVIGTRYGGTPEVVLDGVTGYVINPLRPEEIAARAVELLKNPEKAAAMGEAGYERAKTHFSLAEKVREYVLLYGSVCGPT